MSKKFIKLVERNDAQELKAYFASLPAGKALDLQDELAMLENASPATFSAIKDYGLRFRYSEKAECVFISVVPADVRRPYINRHSLYQSTQTYMIDNNLLEAAQDFASMRHFADIDYVLDNADASVIFPLIRMSALDNDEQIKKLIKNQNKSMFSTYVNQGYFISDEIILYTIENRYISAFTAITARNHRNFKKACKTMTYQQMREKGISDITLAADLQIAVLDTGSRLFIEAMLRTTPLAPVTQKTMFERNFEAEFFKLHVASLYMVQGYCFEPEYEEKLIKTLACKNLDDCLIQFRGRDDVNFVRFASPKTVLKFIKDKWLTDEGQVAVFARGNVELIKALISRFTPDHGMCWQAEVKMVEVCSEEVICMYIKFHTLCAQALDLLRRKSQKAIDYYYSLHSY